MIVDFCAPVEADFARRDGKGDIRLCGFSLTLFPQDRVDQAALQGLDRVFFRQARSSASDGHPWLERRYCVAFTDPRTQEGLTYLRYSIGVYNLPDTSQTSPASAVLKRIKEYLGVDIKART